MSVYLLRYVIFLTICFNIVTHAFAVTFRPVWIDETGARCYNKAVFRKENENYKRRILS